MFWARPADMLHRYSQTREYSPLFPLRPGTMMIVLVVGIILLFPGSVSASVALIEMVRTALEHSPGLLLEKQNLRTSESAMLSARSAFDPQISLSSLYSRTESTPLIPELKTVSSTVSSSTLLPIGVTVAPNVSVKGNTTPPAPAVNIAAAGVTFTVPLLQGLGNNTRRMLMSSTLKSYRAEGCTLQHTAATTINSAAAAYWNYVFAYQTLKVDQQLTHNAEDALRATKALAIAGDQPLIKASQAEAYLQQKKAVEITDAQALRQAWSDLFLAIGCSIKGREIPEPPVDSFPRPDQDLSLLADISKLKAKALASRADLQSLRLLIEAANDNLAGSRNNMKPKIDLALYAGYSGQYSGSTVPDYFAALTSQVQGANVSATLTYTFATANNSKESTFISNSAIFETAVINRDVLERTIGDGVGIAAESVKNCAATLRLVMKSAETYRFLNTTELKKFRSGISDLYKVQQVSTDMASAEQQLLAAEKAYAFSILNFRYQIAALMHERDGIYNVDERDLVTIPALDNTGSTL